jgi:hypothetical protein
VARPKPQPKPPPKPPTYRQLQYLAYLCKTLEVQLVRDPVSIEEASATIAELVKERDELPGAQRQQIAGGAG